MSIDEQVDLLQRRGMRFDDPDAARHVLAYVGYYRLRAYWQPLESKVGENQTHAFHPGVRFEDAVARYAFDQRLKLLLMDAIERVEIALRARWTHQLAMRYGSHAYLDGTLFQQGVQHAAHARPDAGANQPDFWMDQSFGGAGSANARSSGTGYGVSSTLEDATALDEFIRWSRAWPRGMISRSPAAAAPFRAAPAQSRTHGCPPRTPGRAMAATRRCRRPPSRPPCR